MSITDPIEAVYNPKRGRYYLRQGREVFYDDERYLREWDTASDALCWAVANIPAARYVVNKDQDEPAPSGLDLGPLFGLRAEATAD